MDTQKIVILIIVVAALAFGGWYMFSPDNSPANTMSSGPQDTEVVAIVNNEEITNERFDALKTQFATQQGVDMASLDEATENQLETQVVDQLISQTLLEQAVDTADIEVSDEEVDEQVDLVVTQVGGQEAFEQALNTEGLSEDEFRAQLVSDLATQTYLEGELDFSSITATEEEVEEAYNQTASQNPNIPSLEEVQGQLEQSVIQQKQQTLIAQHVEELRADADIEILL